MSPAPPRMTIFLAGIIQGSLPDGIEPQDWRVPMIRALEGAFPDATIYDPIAEHPDSLAFDDAKAERIFFDLMRRAGEADLLTAYLPSASMGTAIEIWSAHRAGLPIVAVSPMTLNWVLRFCTDHVCPTLDDFVAFAGNGGLRRLVDARREERT
ncbi:MAG: hypothetical protein ACOCX4_04920 [Planctomycetota bacterium]